MRQLNKCLVMQKTLVQFEHLKIASVKLLLLLLLLMLLLFYRIGFLSPLITLYFWRIYFVVKFESRDLASLETVMNIYEIRTLIFGNVKNATLLPKHITRSYFLLTL